MTEERAKSPQVRGIVLIAIREFVQTHLPPSEKNVFFNTLSSDVKRTVFNAEKGEWYPYATQSRLHNHIAHWFKSPDPRQTIRDLGLFVANYEIDAFLRPIFSFLPFDVIMDRFHIVWEKLYRPGIFSVLSSNNTGAVFELSEFSSDPLFCPMIEGWLKVVANYLKLKNLSIKETSCIHRGQQSCRWEVSWGVKDSG